MKTVPSRWLNRRVCESALILIVAVSWSSAIYAQDPAPTPATTAASTQDSPAATSDASKPEQTTASAAPAPSPAPVLAAHEPLPATPALAVSAYDALPAMPAAVLAAHEPRPAPVMSIVAPQTPAAAAPTAAGNAVTNNSAAIVELIAGRSALVDIGATISRVSVTDADIADALVTSHSQLLVHGKVPGTISMFVWNTGGVRRYEIAVQRDVTRLGDQLKDLFPRETIHVRSNGKYVVLSGNVSTKEVATKIADVAASFVEKKDEVVSVLQLQPPAPVSQVLLRVRFAEVSRSALTEFGLGLFTSPTGINNTLGRITTQQFSAPTFSDLEWSKASSEFGSDVTSASGKFSFSDFLNFFLLSEKYDLGAVIRAMQQRGLFQSLAEPNLVAESGKEASFLAGGEFPIPVVQGSQANAAVSVQFKEFGIRLNFVPTVIGDRVHLRVRPEVSTLDFGNAVVMNGFRIPALSTRRTETELELLNNQTFAIAGLINNRMSSTMQKIPGIGDIPILGHLFRSRAAQKDQTELVVMITPQILTTGSVGVTNQLPRLQEPYLPAQPENPRAPQPPPAFQGQAR
jgi:pilus assembly protein CpaC